MTSNGYTLTVAQLNEYVSNMLQREPLLKNLSVRGEVSGFKRHSSGHVYFSLKDEAALIRCVMFRQNAAGLNFDMCDGMQVCVTGSVSIYVRDGQYQLYVTSAEEEGSGLLYKRFLLLKTRLEAQGLFDPAHKKALPALPRTLGVVTSPTGAALQDIITVTRRRFPGMNITLFPVRVQGEGAAAEIAAAIDAFNRQNAADVLIVGRGGGSMEDLWAFNEQIVAQAIFDSDIPIVSAVGHETDFSISDFTADLRAPTPSAAAELCVPVYDEVMQKINDTVNRMSYSCQAVMTAHRRRITAAMDSYAFAAPGELTKRKRLEIAARRSDMENAAQNLLAASCNALSQRKSALSALSPLTVLERGYALLKSDRGYLTSAAQLSPGDDVNILMRDGNANAAIKDVEWKKERT